MLPLFFYTVAVFGLCYILGHARVSLGVRVWLAPPGQPRPAAWRYWLVELVECPACLGFWLGLVAGFAWPWLVPAQVLGVPVALALYTCGANFLLGRATGLIKE